MTKKQAPAPKPSKPAPKRVPSRGLYIDFKPRNVKGGMSRPKSTKTAQNAAQAAKTAKTAEDEPVSVRVSRTTVISTTKQKANKRDYLPPAKEEDFDEEPLFSDIDFEDESPVFTEEEVALIDDGPEETPEDFMSEKSTDEYASALTALKVTAASESPFIASVSVDKRPLSDGRRLTEDDYGLSSTAPTSIREEDFHGPTRNVYTRRRDMDLNDNADRRHKDSDLSPELPKRAVKSRELLEKEAKVDTRITPEKDTRSLSFALVIAITLMVIFGGAIGAVVYLAFFQ